MSADVAISRFLVSSAERLPTAAELVALCKDLEITFGVVEGTPVMKPPKCNREVALLVAKLITREPWRSQVIELAKLQVPNQQQTPLDGSELG